MLESSIRIGILPSNSAYGQIVSKSSAAFQIADTDNNVIYRSDNAVILSDSQMENAKKNNVMIDENTVLLSDSIYLQHFSQSPHLQELLIQIRPDLQYP